MDADFKRRWVAALRSGKYQQGRYYLQSGNGQRFCCMGVACDLVDSSRWRGPNDLREGRNWGDLHSVLADGDLARELKLSVDVVERLAQMNDATDQKSFAQIADWIEVHI